MATARAQGGLEGAEVSLPVLADGKSVASCSLPSEDDPDTFVAPGRQGGLLEALGPASKPLSQFPGFEIASKVDMGTERVAHRFLAQAKPASFPRSRRRRSAP